MQRGGLGTLYMTPSRIFHLADVKIDSRGIDKLSFTIPSDRIDHLVLVCQPIVMTKPGTVQLTSWSGLINSASTTEGVDFEGGAMIYDDAKNRIEVDVYAAPGKFKAGDSLLLIVGTGTGSHHERFPF